MPAITTTVGRFQSSSGLPAGCNPRGTSAWGRTGGFNPHPAFRPDATPPDEAVVPHSSRVSILIRPSGRMQPASLLGNVAQAIVFQSSSGLPAGCNGLWAGSCRVCGVSILIRPEGRMQQVARAAPGQLTFQSSSGLPAGCNPGPQVTLSPARIHALFQSSSGLPAGCNHRMPPLRPRAGPVSIPLRRTKNHSLDMFQSSSGLPAGCNRRWGVGDLRAEAFQEAHITTMYRFNPHPAFRPDATGGR